MGPSFGLGIKNWGDQLGVERLQMFLAGTNSTNATFKDALHGAIHRLGSHYSSSKPALTYYLPNALPGMSKQWLEQVWRWVSESGYTVEYDGMALGDMAIADRVQGHCQKHTALEGCRAFNVSYRRELLQHDG